jgi:hypothetical protein
VGDPLGALLAAVAIVGVVMLGVVLVAWLGVRYSTRPPSERTMRRLARLNIAFGLLAILFAAVAWALGAGLYWFVGLVQGPLFILLGWSQLRQLDRAAYRS